MLFKSESEFGKFRVVFILGEVFINIFKALYRYLLCMFIPYPVQLIVDSVGIRGPLNIGNKLLEYLISFGINLFHGVNLLKPLYAL